MGRVRMALDQAVALERAEHAVHRLRCRVAGAGEVRTRHFRDGLIVRESAWIDLAAVQQQLAD